MYSLTHSLTLLGKNITSNEKKNRLIQKILFHSPILSSFFPFFTLENPP